MGTSKEGSKGRACNEMSQQVQGLYAFKIKEPAIMTHGAGLGLGSFIADWKAGFAGSKTI